MPTTKLYLFLAAMLFASASFSQKQIKIEEVKDHVGDSVTVCSKVYSTRFLATSKNEPTFLNLGAGFPNQLLTVVIWSDVRKQFEIKPEDFYKNKIVCVSGKVELYSGKPQIIVNNPQQITCSDCN